MVQVLQSCEAKKSSINNFSSISILGLKGGGMKDERQEEGVPDMTVMSDINEAGINNNLQLRYQHDNIYVSLYYNLF